MIETLQICNFKRFQDTTVNLGGLTVLTGTNGTGKTSLIHALLLMQRTASSPRPATVALNDDHGLQLGEGNDVLNWNAKESEIRFRCTTTAGEEINWRFEVPDERALHLPLDDSGGTHNMSQLSARERAFAYISAERLGPRDALSASSVSLADLGVGCFGQYVAQVLAVLDRAPVPQVRRTASPRGETTLSGLRHQTEWWTSRIIRPIEFEAEWFANTMITRLRFKTPGIRGEWTRSPNMGFGVSYALPVIVAGLIAPRGGLLIIENPEAHLHPAGQSEIGRFLARVAADGVQVIVETHSDHVINGIRHAVASPEHPVSPKDCTVLFFQPESNLRVVETLEISASGAMSSWPAGFFDQVDRDLRALTDLQRAQRPRRRRR